MASRCVLLHDSGAMIGDHGEQNHAPSSIAH